MTFSVPVKVWLPNDLHRELVGHARRRDIDVAELLARLAAASVKYEPQPLPVVAAPQTSSAPDRVIGKHAGNGRLYLTPERMAQAHALREQGLEWRAVAVRIGCAVSSLYAALRREKQAQDD